MLWLVECFTERTRFLRTTKVVGFRAVHRVSESLDEAAMESQASDFISDPHAITDQTATMGEFVANVGHIDEPVPTAELFAFGPYDAINS